jgi:hypothetical protein
MGPKMEGYRGAKIAFGGKQLLDTSPGGVEMFDAVMDFQR